ncbi:hypothetical protein ACSHWO_34755 [Streptomyces sp. HUAS TT3]|uniref:hypothetical protein n=1 Tax=Streptomyces sp. HUAS TT3 TaxID=3447510 RepID=UPI003F655D0D
MAPDASPAGRGGEGATGRSQTHQAKQETTQAEALIIWLADRGRTIEHCRQADLGGWHTEKPATRRPAQTFLRWCMKMGRMPRLAMLRRVLNDDSLPLRSRVVAALVLLYAQPVSRIVCLTIDDITDDGTVIAVRLGDPPSPLPSPSPTCCVPTSAPTSACPAPAAEVPDGSSPAVSPGSR